MTPLPHYLLLSAFLLFVGIIGALSRRNGLIVLMSVELMLNAANLAFVAFSRFLGDASGQVLVFFVIAVAAAEVAVGLAIVIALFRNTASVNLDDATRLGQ
jgi:NADH-quinone oxidoreductase subunit K